MCIRDSLGKVPASLAQVLHHRLLLAGELDACGLALALEHVHGIVVLHQQGFDPAAMGIDLAIARLLLQRLVHDRRQPLVTLATQTASDVGPVSYTHLDVYKRQPLGCMMML